jgi:hypothetical protein
MDWPDYRVLCRKQSFGVAATPPSPKISGPASPVRLSALWWRRPRRRKFPGVLWHNPGCDEASQPPFGHHFYKAITGLNRSIFDEIRHVLNNFLEYEC